MSVVMLLCSLPLLTKPKLTSIVTLPLASALLYIHTMDSQETISSLWYTDQFSSTFSLVSTWLNSLTPLFYGPLVPLTLSTVGSLVFYNSSTWLILFIAFETSMLPVYYLLQSKGYQPERMRAAHFMLLYTTFSSSPLLVMIVTHSLQSQSYLYLTCMEPHSLPFPFLFLLAFMVKTPVYTMHSWLPLAHVESPLAGSVFLAGVLLKFSIVGMYRSFSLYPSLYGSNVMAALVAVCMLGSIYSACTCWVVVDLKVVVAYASVSHMNVSLASLLMHKMTTLHAVYLSAISHSFCSSLLFLLVSMSSKLTNSRSHYVNLGVLSTSLLLAMSNLLAWVMNMNIPPNVGFLGEIEYLQTFSSQSTVMVLLLAIYILLSSFYSMSVYGSTSHSPFSVKVKVNDTPLSFYLSVACLVLPPLVSFALPNQLQL
nr:NADH dehydrogenase subunit 4 [Antarctophthirus microchir]